MSITKKNSKVGQLEQHNIMNKIEYCGVGKQIVELRQHDNTPSQRNDEGPLDPLPSVVLEAATQ